MIPDIPYAREPLSMRRWVLLLAVMCLLSACDSNEINLIPVKRYVIPQNGMSPSLPANSTFWAIRRPFLDVSDIKRGEVIVFYQKQNGKEYDFVWRVVGLPHDRIEIKDTDVWINDVRLVHEERKERSGQIIFMETNHGSRYPVVYDKDRKVKNRMDLRITVPESALFLLGDNRDDASDSRVHGMVSFDHVIGKKL